MNGGDPQVALASADGLSTATDGSISVIKIAVMAVGGQGGGVLTGWIADLATRAGYSVQMTSVAGVAQRTGATIYYVEMAAPSSESPVFALSPSPGDVDVLIASELMEAGRAILRGFVTEDKTTLIASTHRVLAISEKQVPGDGRAEAEIVANKLASSAYKSVCFDMQSIAESAGTMISASLFGALARSGALPFDQHLYEDIISGSKRGVEQSLAAFHAAIAYDIDETNNSTEPAALTTSDPIGPKDKIDRWLQLRARVNEFPDVARSMAVAGLTQVVDYQDLDYGEEYIEHVNTLIALDDAKHDYKLTNTAAKYIANAMCYDDIVRVADLKTRSSRDSRLRREQQVDEDQIVQVTEYFHPRAEEFCATLPMRLGAWIENSPMAFSIVQKLIDRGRRIRTDGMFGFSLLWVVAGLRCYRRKLLRHRYESEHLTQLLFNTRTVLDTNYALAVEVLQCQRLIKGYSDTHSRSQSKFERVTEAALASMQNSDAAEWVAQLRDVALHDEHGDQLNELINSGLR